MTIANIDKYISIGSKDKDWYALCAQCFIELFGVEKLSFVSNLFAATSINSSLKSNIRLFRKAKHEIENGLPFSNYLPVMLLQLERIRSGEPLSGRKIRSFAAAMAGDTNAVVVDIWLLRAFEEDKKWKRSLSGREQSSGASAKQYDLIELYVRERAQLMGIEPRQLSAMIWSGARIWFSGDRNTHYRELLNHQMFNMYESTN